MKSWEKEVESWGRDCDATGDATSRRLSNCRYRRVCFHLCGSACPTSSRREPQTPTISVLTSHYPPTSILFLCLAICLAIVAPTTETFFWISPRFYELNMLSNIKNELSNSWCDGYANAFSSSCPFTWFPLFTTSGVRSGLILVI